MNKFTITNLIAVILCFFTLQINAQDGYTYTLIPNGNYSFTIGAVPNTSSSNFPTSVQSYGFTIILPDGITATVTSSLGGAANATFFDGNNVGQTSIDGYLITETLGSPVALPAPSTGSTTPMVTIQVNGSPVSGVIEILANDSALATTVTPLKSFMQADMVDNGTTEFTNVVDPNTSGLSGARSFNFATLSTKDITVDNFAICPNPVSDVLHINSEKAQVTKVEILNISGQLVFSQNYPLETINLSNLKSGLYLVTLYSSNTSETLKLIKN